MGESGEDGVFKAELTLPEMISVRSTFSRGETAQFCSSP